MKPLMAIPSPPSHLRIYYQLTQFSSTFFTELKFKWLLLLLQRGLHRPQFGAATTTNQPESRERTCHHCTATHPQVARAVCIQPSSET